MSAGDSSIGAYSPAAGTPALKYFVVSLFGRVPSGGRRYPLVELDPRVTDEVHEVQGVQVVGVRIRPDACPDAHVRFLPEASRFSEPMTSRTFCARMSKLDFDEMTVPGKLTVFRITKPLPRQPLSMERDGLCR